jgi:Organic solvent tolerance protein OstA
MTGGATTADRSVPTFSLDSGLVFERPTSLFGRALTQTLEPRLYYVYTPYRNQQNLPNFDSADLDLNLSTIYTDNVFSGNDRIADANNLTGGVTSRLSTRRPASNSAAHPGAAGVVRAAARCAQRQSHSCRAERHLRAGQRQPQRTLERGGRTAIQHAAQAKPADRRGRALVTRPV